MQVTGIEYVEFYVGNVPQAAHFYRTALGDTAGPRVSPAIFSRWTTISCR